MNRSNHLKDHKHHGFFYRNWLGPVEATSEIIRNSGKNLRLLQQNGTDYFADRNTLPYIFAIRISSKYTPEANRR
jgi:hypothetical protein